MAQAYAQTEQDQSSKTPGNMTTTDFTTTISVDQSPQQVFNAINNVRGWWSEDIEGSTDKLNKTFDYHFRDLHRCKVRVIEMIADKKVVWSVEDNYFDFTEDKSEWTGTQVIFEIAEEGKQTRLVFTHKGLVPEYECYDVCRDAWTGFIQKSLFNLITTGKGDPNPKEGINTINSENIRKHELEN